MGRMIGLVKYLAVALLFTSLPAELRGLSEFSAVSGLFFFYYLKTNLPLGAVPQAALDSQAIRPRFSVDPGRIINGTEATLGATRQLRFLIDVLS